MKSYTYEDFNEKLKKTFSVYAGKEAFYFMLDSGRSKSISFGDTQELIYKNIELLEKAGVKAGDRAAVITPLSPYAIIAGLTLSVMNVTSVLIDASLPAEDINRLIEFSDVRAILTTKEIYRSLNNKFAECIPCIELDINDGIYSLFEGSTEKPALPETPDREKDVIAVIFSSGTTDKMKGVKITYNSIIHACNCLIAYTGLAPKAKYLNVLPFNHIAGYSVALSCVLTGVGMGFIENVSAAALSGGFARYKPTNFIMIPKVYGIIKDKIVNQVNSSSGFVRAYFYSAMKISGFVRKHTGLKLRGLFKAVNKTAFGGNLTICGCGTAPCPAETEKFYLDMGLDFVNVYGSTEAGLSITAVSYKEKYNIGNVGCVNQFPDIHVKTDVPDANGNGEIKVRTPMIMKGYFRDAERTEAAFDRDGYFKTGDYGYIDENYHLHITGRIKESIVLETGKKVSPADIDEYYNSKLDSIQLASCGIANEFGYDEVHIFILNENYSDEAQRSIRSDIFDISYLSAPMYHIADIHFIDDMPLTSVGKVKRYKLKEFALSDIESRSYTETDVEIHEEFDIIKAVGDMCGKKDGITERSRFQEDLGFDSLTMFELCVEIENAMNIRIAERLSRVSTVEDLIKLAENANSDRETAVSLDVNKFPVSKSDKDMRSLERLIRLVKKVYKFRVKGIENIRFGEQYIFCPNHESYFDAMYCVAALSEKVDMNKISCLAASELLKNRFLKRGVDLIGGIPVDRTGNTSPALKRALEVITEKCYNFIIHPEGTRTRTGKMGVFKEGAARLSIDSGVKIIPVCINGAYEIYPPNRRLPHIFNLRKFRKYPLTVSFGKPVVPVNKTAEQITEEIRKQIIKMKGDL